MAHWITRVGEPNEPRRRHDRKMWEWCFVLDVAASAGLLRDGYQAIGFGVGRERTVAAMAALDVRVLATDQGVSSAKGWVETGQHASALTDLRYDHLCPFDQFRRLVSFRPVDMAEIPNDLVGFDLAWSSCALEHLGSPEAGHQFVLDSIGCVRPGGSVAHTTEARADGGPTVVFDGGGTVIYSVQSLRTLVGEIRRRGHRVRLDARVPWDEPADCFIDQAPFPHDPAHLKLFIGGAVTSSFGLAIKRGR